MHQIGRGRFWTKLRKCLNKKVVGSSPISHPSIHAPCRPYRLPGRFSSCHFCDLFQKFAALVLDPGGHVGHISLLAIWATFPARQRIQRYRHQPPVHVHSREVAGALAPNPQHQPRLANRLGLAGDGHAHAWHHQKLTAVLQLFQLARLHCLGVLLYVT